MARKSLSEERLFIVTTQHVGERTRPRVPVAAPRRNHLWK